MADETTTEETTTGAAETDATDWKAEAEKWQTLARKNEERAKGNANAAKELERVRAAAMTDTEKAVAEAKNAAAAEAARASAPRLVRAELKAAAADAGLPKQALDGFLEYADLSRFVGDDGDIDDKAIGAAIKKLGGGKPANFDGGARTSADKPNDMNAQIRQLAGLG